MRGILRKGILAASLAFAPVSFATADEPDQAQEENVGRQVGEALRDMDTIYGPGGVLDDCYNNNCGNMDDIIDPPEPEPETEPDSEPSTPEPDTD